MRRLLVIPVAGTIAALVVVMLAHEAREEEPGPVFPELPPVLPEDVPEAPVPDDAASPEEEPEAKPKPPPEPPPKPPPPVSEYYLRLEKDGKLVDLDGARSFADTDAVIEGLSHKDTRHRIILSNGEGVEEAALDEILEKLAAKFEVRKVYRAAEKEE